MTSQALFDERPITTVRRATSTLRKHINSVLHQTFFVTFTLLSIIPIVSFMCVGIISLHLHANLVSECSRGFSGLAVASFSIIALTSAFVASILVILAFRA